MIAYPAIDLKGGRAVQLVGGRPGSDRVSLPDVSAVAKQWVDAGFSALHVVDLDAALGTGSNRDIIAEVIRQSNVPVQVGGGVRDDDAVAAWLDAGAARVIAGTRAVEDPAWIAAATQRWPGRMVVAADMRDGAVVTHGWTRGTRFTVEDFIDSLDSIDLAAILVTDVGREGRLEGIDRVRFQSIAQRSRHRIIAAGGVSSLSDLHALASAGLHGAVLGMSLYTGAVDAAAAATEFSR
jgi:phosphoribosylformimino-5-aminoimidazole carboxamide ribotide isomerase